MFPVCCCKWYQASKVQLFKSLGPTAWKNSKLTIAEAGLVKGSSQIKVTRLVKAAFLVEEGSLVKDVCVVKEFTL